MEFDTSRAINLAVRTYCLVMIISKRSGTDSDDPTSMVAMTPSTLRSSAAFCCVYRVARRNVGPSVVAINFNLQYLSDPELSVLASSNLNS